MSILFGLCHAEGHAVEDRQLVELAQATSRYALDGTFVRASGRIGMGFQPFFTHERSSMDQQPLLADDKSMVVFDGRLDNHMELRRALNICYKDTPDSQIVLSAFMHWGEDCFSHFIGDWALSLWSHEDRSLYLARDHAGTRTLYFETTQESILWSTYLETHFANGKTPVPDRAYAARYLCCQSLHALTPFNGISAVLPAHYYVFRKGQLIRKRHWQWMVEDTLSYNSDLEYERRFFSLFRQAVERRTGVGSPIIAELSGGIDSSSIVCMSDHIRSECSATSLGKIDTVSYFDDSEPHWNERPYFTAVEGARGKSGIHLNCTFDALSKGKFDRKAESYLIPGDDYDSLRREEAFLQKGGRDYRVILSGIGGDELFGGVPTPHPELGEYLLSGDIKKYVSRAFAWCTPTRKSLVTMSIEVASFLSDLYLCQNNERKVIPPWISPELRALSTSSRSGCFVGSSFGHSPIAITNAHAWWSVQETLPHLMPRSLARFEYRFPYLDRDLVDFILRIPRTQLVKPGRRRDLMRRSLAGIVPRKILDRPRKAFLSQSRIRMLINHEDEMRELFSNSVLVQHRFIAEHVLQEMLPGILRAADPQQCFLLERTLNMELWMRSLADTSISSDNQIKTLSAPKNGCE